MPWARDPGEPARPRQCGRCRYCLPLLWTRRPRNDERFRGWTLTACFLAVYASHPPVARWMARLTTDLSARLWSGGIYTRWM